MTHDKRLSTRMLNYWKQLNKGGKLPEIQKLNSGAIEDVWSQCFTVSVDTRKGTNYKYEHVGENIAKMYGYDLSGITVNYKAKQFPGAVVLKNLDKVINDKEPVTNEGHLLNNDGQIIKYRACFLPFGDEKKGLTHVVAGLSFRVFQ